LQENLGADALDLPQADIDAISAAAAGIRIVGGRYTAEAARHLERH
jgi:hypothetical protein